MAISEFWNWHIVDCIPAIREWNEILAVFLWTFAVIPKSSNLFFRGSVGRRSSLKVESHLIHHHSSTLCLINLISILGLLPTFICHRSGSIWFGAWRWSGNAQRGRGCVRERSVARLAKNWVDDWGFCGCEVEGEKRLKTACYGERGTLHCDWNWN